MRAVPCSAARRLHHALSVPSMRKAGSVGANEGAAGASGRRHGADSLVPDSASPASPLPAHMRLRSTTSRSLPERAASGSARPGGKGGRSRWHDFGAEDDGMDSDASPLDGSVTPVKVVDLSQLRAIGRGTSAATMTAFDMNGSSTASASHMVHH